MGEDPVRGYAVTIGGDCAPDGSVTLNIGDFKNCTITSDDVAPRLTVTKVVVNGNGGTRQASDFPLFVDGGPVVSGTANSFKIGLHGVSETSRPGYAGVIGADCAASGSIWPARREGLHDHQRRPSLHLHAPAEHRPDARPDGSRRDDGEVEGFAGPDHGGGNAWKEIGTWSVASTPFSGTVVGLNDLHAFLGLKTSDDEGRRFDVRGEIYRNGALLTSGETLCVAGITRSPDRAKDVVIAPAPFPAVAFNSTDTMALKVLARMGTAGNGLPCGGGGGAGIRLYFDAVRNASRLGYASP